MTKRACVAVLLLLFLAGCGEDSTVEPINRPPTISFDFLPIAVAQQTDVEMSVTVADPDEDDRLTVAWEITRGALTPVNSENTAVTWTVPDALGTDTVTVAVSDGKDRVTIRRVLKVGTAVTSSPGTWRKVDSPYVLAAASTPPRLSIGGINVIEAGVEIYVDLEGTTIDVTGSLTANGTDAEPVVIRANDRSLRCGENRGWWEGILVGTDGGNSGNVTLNHTEIWYAARGVRLRDTGSATIRNSSLQCCGTYAVLHEGTGTLVVTGCEIKNGASTGIAVNALTLLPASVTITENDISINDNTGIYLSLNDQMNEVPIVIEGNRIEFNLSHGLVMERWVWPQVHYNHISSNGGGLSNIRLQGDFFHDAANPDTLDFSCNYWGRPVSSKETIDDTIRDRSDSAGLGSWLDVVPWLNEDPFGAQTPPPCDGQPQN